MLVGYPLRTEGRARDELLNGLPAQVKILFVSGDCDGDGEEVESVCKELKCQSWKIAVQGANEALKVETSDTGTQEIAKMTGAVVARWPESCDEEMRDGKIVWNADKGVARWSGWAWNLKDKTIDGRDQDPKPATVSGKKASQRKGNGNLRMMERKRKMAIQQRGKRIVRSDKSCHTATF